MKVSGFHLRGANRVFRGRLAAVLAVFACLTPVVGFSAVATVGLPTNATSGNSKTLSINPAGLVGGNILVARILISGVATAPVGPNASWTLRTTSSSVAGNCVLTTWTHTVTAGEVGPYVWTIATNQDWAGGITQYSGVDLFCPVGATGTSNGTSVTTGKRSTFALPEITTQVPNAVVDGSYGVAVKNKTFTQPAGWTRLVAARTGARPPSAGSANRAQAAVGLTGAANTVSVNVTANPYVADLIELDPPDTTGVTLAPAALSFATVKGSSPASQTFTITNTHLKNVCPNQTYAAAVTYSAGWDATNMPAPNVSAVSLAQGATSAAITISIASSLLDTGTYTAVIAITDASGNTAAINVTLSVACSIQREANVATAAAGAATALALTDPGGWSDGDGLVATLVADTTTAPATPAGWTLVASNTTGALGMWMYRAARSGDATTTWTGFASGRLAGVMAAYLNVNNFTPLDAPAFPFAPATTLSGDGNVDTNACTTGTANVDVVAAYAINMTNAGTALTVGAGLTSISGNVSTGAAVGDIVLNVGSDRIVAGAGTPLAETGTVLPSQAASKLGGLCTLRPANVPPAVSVTRLPAAPSQGDTVTYIIAVTNPAGNGPFTDLMLSDTLPAGVTFVSLGVDAAGAGLTLSSNPGAGAVEGAYGTLTTPLAAGSAVTFTLQGVLDCGVVAAQSSTAFARTGGTCGTPGTVLNAFTPGVVAAPAVTVSRDLIAPTQGDLVTYSVVVTNASATAPLNALVFSDSLPAGLSVVSFAADGAGAGLALATAGQVVGASGDFATPVGPGNSVTFTVVARVGCGPGVLVPQSNQAYAQTASNCLRTLSAADTFTPGPVAAPDVTLGHVPAAPAEGGPVTYMIVVRNMGTMSLNSLVVSDTLPAGVSFVSLEAGSDGSGDGLVLSANAGAGAVEGASGVFTPGLELAAGASFTLTLTGTVVCGASGAQSHQAYAETPGGCQKTLSATDAFNLATVGVSVVKTQVVPAAGATIAAGDLVRYRIVVTNTGAVTVTSVLLVDTLAPQVVNVTTTATGFALPAVVSGAGGTVYAWTGAGLTMGPNLSYTFTVTGQAGVTCAATVIGNTAYVSAGTACAAGILSSSAASGTFTLSPPALAVQVQKTMAGGTWPGQAVSYSVIVTNAGSATITNLVIVDTVSPVVVGAVAGTPAGWASPVVTSVASGTLFAWTGSGLTFYPGTTTTFTISGSIGVVCAATQVSNTGFAIAASACSTTVLVTNAVGVLVPAPTIGMSVAKVLLTSPAQRGDPVGYRIVVTNTGTSTVVSLTVVDTLAPQVVAVTTTATGFALPAVADSTSGAGTVYAWSGTGLAMGPGASFTFTITGQLGFSIAPVTVGNTVFVGVADACGAAAGTAASGTFTTATAAVLAASVAAYTSPLCAGDPTLVTVTVTNTGGATALSVGAPDFTLGGTGSAIKAAGPNPAGPVTLAGGASATFTWTYTGGTSGSSEFTTTVAGQDQNSGLALTTGPVTSNAILVRTPGALAVAAAAPAFVSVGQWFAVTLTVTNTGETVVSALTPAIAIGPGAALVTAEPPAPGGTSLAGGASTTFVWTYSAAGSGLVAFTASAAGTTCAATNLVAAVTVSTTLQTPAALVAAAAALPTTVGVGQTFLLTVTVTNTGAAPATGVAPAPPVVAGAGVASFLAGPSPAGPVSLAGGASIVFTWTYSGSSSGVVDLTTTVTGTDVNTVVALSTGAVVAGPVTIVPSGTLVSRETVSALPVSVGQWIRVTFTVTNEGGVAASAVTPGLVNASTAVLALISGPVPAGPLTLAAGGATTFVWTFSASGAGSLALSLTATGTDGGTGDPLYTFQSQFVPVAVQTPAALAAAVAMLPAQVSVGQSFLVTVTVTNTGQAGATGVTPAGPAVGGAGTATVAAGPTPGAPVPVAGGASVTFTWTMTASAAGSVGFTTTVTGADANAGWALTTGPRTAAGLIQTAAALTASLHAFPSPRDTGQAFLVTLTVTNSGAAAATGVDASAILLEGTGGATAVGGPTPAMPVTIPGGTSMVFTWTYSGTAAGTVRFTTTVTAADGNAGWAVTTGPVMSGAVVIETPAALAAAVAMLPAQVSVGQGFLVTVTVTNSGMAGATSVAPAMLAASGTGAVVLVDGPFPSIPVPLAGGGAVTFTWTMTASSAGSMVLTSTVTGTDANTAAALTTGPKTASGVIQTVAALTASLEAFPSPRNTGQGFLLTLTVTNSGQAAATGVDSSAFLLEGTGGAAVVGGPTPAMPVTIPGGTSMVFTWTYAGSADGTVRFTTTVTAVDGNAGWAVTTGPVMSGVVVIETPAALAAAVAMLPAQVSVGQSFLVTVTVTNSGGAMATGVTAAPLLETGAGVTVSGGPWPAGPASLGAGVAVTFTWTFTAASAGTALFTATATGTDANTAAALSSGPASVSGVVQTAATLSAALLAFPSPRNVGQGFLVTLTITNTGQASALGVDASGFLLEGTGGATVVGGPTPVLPATIPGGASMVFTWTYSGATAGTVRFTTTVAGTDANSAAAVTTGPVMSGAVVIETPAALAAAVAMLPAQVSVGQGFLVTVTVTNSGGATAAGVAAAPLLETGAGVTPVGGPWPAGPVSLGTGTAVTFTWTFTAASAGTALFTATATGTDANTAAALSSGPASVSGVVQTAATLSAALLAFPSPRNVGQGFLVTLTITNTGQASALGVDASGFLLEGTGGATVVGGPTPVLPATIPGGASMVFTWTYSGATAGTVRFTTTVAGTDANSAAALTTGSVMSGVVVVQTPAAVQAALAALPSTVGVGQDFLVTLTVTNTGGTTATGVSAPEPVVAGTGVASFLAGPLPAMPVTLVGGASVTFTWTFSGASSGLVDLTTTVTGTDANTAAAVSTGPVVVGPVTIVPSGTLVSRVTVTVLPVSVGQWITVALTVTNDGGVPANAVIPGVVNASTAALALVSGPVPAGPVTLGPGAAQVFVWTFSASGAGSLALSLTTTGTDGGTGDPLYTFQSVFVPVAVQTPATLAASVAMLPPQLSVGQPFLVTVTVTNTGQAGATGVAPAGPEVAGPGAATVVAGPTPASPMPLAGGASVTFTWTMTASAAGIVGFTATVTGADGNAGWALTTGPVTAAGTIQTAAALTASLDAFPTPRNVAQGFLVTLTVANSGGAAATGVNASAFLLEGTGAASVSAGPNPALPVTISGGATRVFTWTLTGSTAGTVWATTTVSGADANSGVVLTAGPAWSGVVVVQAPAALAASAAALPATVGVGQAMFLTVTVTNTGQATATGVAPAAPVAGGTGALSAVAGPFPAGSVTIAGGAMVVFTWTYDGASVGSVGLTTTVTGTDANTAAALTTGPVTVAPITVVPAGSLLPAVSVSPMPVSVGQQIRVALTVTNTGGTAANNVTPALVDGSAAALTLLSGPVPPGPVTLASGAGTTFVWTFSAAGAGAVALSLTATGTDGGSGDPLYTAMDVAGLVQTPAALAASAAAYAGSVCGPFLVTLTVTNTGQATAVGVNALGPVDYFDAGSPLPIGPSTPAMPVALAGGAAVTFTWTHVGGVPGTYILTSTAFGTDQNDGSARSSGPAVAGTVTVQNSGALVASSSAPVTVSFGQEIAVRLTVTNAGGSNVTGISATVYVNPGSASIAAVSWPLNSLMLPAGSATTFEWRYAAISSGTVSFTMTAAGLTCGAVPMVVSRTVTATVQIPAALGAAVAMLPAQVSVGQAFLVTVTVTNTGGATATGVTAAPLLETGAGVTPVGGPWPAGPVTLGGAASVTFTWTFSAASAGTAIFTATATGTDANTAAALTSGPVSVSGLVQMPAALDIAAVLFPASVGQGQALWLTVTVTNIGQAAATVVVPATPAVWGSGSVVAGAGPWPAAPVTVAGGSAVTFTWTYVGGAVGSAGLTTTVTGLDGNADWVLASGPISAGPVTVTPAADLVSATATSPLPVSVGQWITVAFTVTNEGGTAANGVTPGLANASTAVLTLVTGPVPAGPLALAPGAVATFVWTYSSAGAGTVALSLTATGTDAGTGVPVWTTKSVVGVVQTPASIAAAVAVLPASVGEGQAFLVTVTVTNSGQAPAIGVAPSPPGASGSGTASLAGGPWPAAPVSVPGGTSVVFTWTCTAGTAGTLGFTATVAGSDANSGAVLTTGPAVSAPVTVNPAATLVSAGSVSPAAVSAGQWITVTLTVTNVGGVAASAVTPGLVNSSTAPMTAVSGPVPAGPLGLAAGAAATFVWTFSTNGAGSVAFGLTATGTDSGSGAPLFTAAALSFPGAVTAPAALAARAAVIPPQVSVGQAFLLTVTVTNTGSTSATGVVPAGPSASGPGGATVAGGPLPAGPVTIAGGAAITFTWTMTASSAGTLALTATAAGADASSGLPVTGGPAAASVLVQTPAALSAGLSASATTVRFGEPLVLTLTISNSGSAAATGVPLPDARAWGTAGGMVTGWPFGGFPATVTGGGTLSFTWTVTMAFPATVGWCLTVTGVDANTWGPLSVVAATSVPITVFGNPDAYVAAVTASPASVNIGDTITVVVTVVNPGLFVATLVNAYVAVGGPGQAELIASLSPSADITGAGGSATFTFTYRATAPGSVTFTGGATYIGASGPIATMPSSAVTILAGVTAGENPKDVVVGPHPFTPARGGTMTFSRIPAGSTVRVFTIAGEPVATVRSDGLGTAAWNGRNDAGSVVLPAVYLFVVESPDGRRHTGKLQVDR